MLTCGLRAGYGNSSPQPGLNEFVADEQTDYLWIFPCLGKLDQLRVTYRIIQKYQLMLTNKLCR